MLTAWRCDRCGKFRRASDIAQYDVGDQVTHDTVTECRWCMPVAVLEQFGMANPD